jgi:predicted transcriptional regulator
MDDQPDNANKERFAKVHHLVIEHYLTDIGAYGLAVFVVISHHANAKGKAWPSVRRMAGRLKISERTVNRMIGRLAKAGLIHVKREALKGGGCRNIYTILPLSDYEAFSKATELRAQSAPESLSKTTDVRRNKTHRKTRPIGEQDPDLFATDGSITEREQPRKARDELFETLVEVTGSDPVVSGSYIGRVRKALLSAEPPFTSADVRQLIELAPRIIPNFRPGPVTLGFIEQFIGRVRAPVESVNTPNRPQGQTRSHGSFRI